MGDDALAADAGELLTVPHVAQRSGVSRHTIRSWLTYGQLPAMRIAGRRYIRPVDVAAVQALLHPGAVVPAWRHDPRRVGKPWRALWEAAEISQLQLAATRGLTHDAVSRLEVGHPAPPGESVRRLADGPGSRRSGSSDENRSG